MWVPPREGEGRAEAAEVGRHVGGRLSSLGLLGVLVGVVHEHRVGDPEALADLDLETADVPPGTVHEGT